MKAIYRITNKAGVTLCFQVARNSKDAVSFARMYGHRAAKAEFVGDEA